MRVRRERSPLIRRIAVIGTLILASIGLLPTASADSAWHDHSHSLVVIGDSYASGVGNVPYIDPVLPCKRSPIAYGPLLARARSLTLTFVACSGAKTVDLLVDPNGGQPQIDSVNQNTDIVTVQALGNDFFASTLERLCIQAECAPATPLPPSPVGEYPPGTTVQDVIDSIPVKAPALLDSLYDAIKQRSGGDANVIAPGYPDPFPAPNGRVGPFCPFMSPVELGVAQDFIAALDKQIRKAANRHGFHYASVMSAFAGHDMCGTSPAFFTLGPISRAPVADPQGVLHPNALGQQLYATAIGARVDHSWSDSAAA